MNQDQIEYVVSNSQWSEEKREWSVPYFVYKEKSMGLPKLGNQSSAKKENVEIEKDKKEVIIKTSHK